MRFVKAEAMAAINIREFFSCLYVLPINASIFFHTVINKSLNGTTLPISIKVTSSVCELTFLISYSVGSNIPCFGSKSELGKKYSAAKLLFVALLLASSKNID